MLKKSGVDEEQPIKDKKKNKKEKGYNKIGDKSPDGPSADGSNRNNRAGKPSSLKKPTFRLPSTGKKEKQKSVKINEQPIVDRPRSSTVPSLSAAASSGAYPELDMSMPNISPLPADLVVLLEGRPVFGQQLASAPRCHDTALPVIVRECIDYLEQRLASASTPSQMESLQGLYQRAADKVAVDRLRDSYERGELVSLDSCNPADVAGLLQAYLRSLPAPLLTTNLIPQFEHAADSRPERCVPELRQLLAELPPLNRTVLAWLSVHLRHLCSVTSVKPASLALSLQTTLQMSHRLLVVFIDHVDELFPGVTIRPYVPQWVLCLPDAISAVEEDLRWREMHLEGLLARLAANSSAELGGEPTAIDKAAVEQSWEQQRIVTQLKRKLKKLKKYTEASRRPSTIASTPTNMQEVSTNATPKSSTEPGSTNSASSASAVVGNQQTPDSHGGSFNRPMSSSSAGAQKQESNAQSSQQSQNQQQQTNQTDTTKQQPQQGLNSQQQFVQSANTSQTEGDQQQAAGDNARVLYAELKDLFGLLKMMKVRNPQNVGTQSADSSMILAPAREADVTDTTATKPVSAPAPAQAPAPVVTAEPYPVQSPNGVEQPVAPESSPPQSTNVPGKPETNENTAPSIINAKYVEKETKPIATSPVSTQPPPQQQNEEPALVAAELLEQRRSIQLAYLWLKIEETEYQTLIAETERQLEQEHQMIKQLAGVISEQRDPDTDSFADSESGLNVPATIAGSSMALVAHDELANEDDSGSTTSDEDTHLNNTHKAVMLMRQNEKLERAIQELERNVITESEECLQLRVQLRFLELLSTSSNEGNNNENSAILVSQMMMTTTSPSTIPPPEIGAV